MQIFVNYLFELLVPITVGVLSTLITYRLTRRKFISERWWEKKAETYTRIIEAMWHLRNYYHTSYGDAIDEANITKERKEELWKHWRAGMDEVERVAIIGEFMISEEATAFLQAYLKKPEISYQPGEWDSKIYDDYVRTSNSLMKLIEIARKDLEIKR